MVDFANCSSGGGAGLDDLSPLAPLNLLLFTSEVLARLDVFGFKEVAFDIPGLFVAPPLTTEVVAGLTDVGSTGDLPTAPPRANAFGWMVVVTAVLTFLAVEGTLLVSKRFDWFSASLVSRCRRDSAAESYL